MAFNVAVLVGSLRKGSISRSLALGLGALKEPDLDLKIIEIGDLPLYNQDLDTGPAPPAWVAFREAITKSHAVLFVTPEYNRSVPAALKNALDVGSRPYGKSVWTGKPGGIISVAPGLLGAFGANHHLRQSLVFLNVLTLQQPEAYISNAGDLTANGVITSESTATFLRDYLRKFAAWVALHTKNS